MKKPLKAYFTLVFIFLALIVISCKDKTDNPQPEDTSKVTSLNLTLDTTQKGHQDASASLQNADGIDGMTGNAIILDANGSYAGTMVLEDATNTPTTNVTSAYTISYLLTGTDATISAAGSTPTITTRTAGSGTLSITLAKDTKTTTVTFPLTIR